VTAWWSWLLEATLAPLIALALGTGAAAHATSIVAVLTFAVALTVGTFALSSWALDAVKKLDEKDAKKAEELV
jgi:hypothetical protein